MNPLYKPPLISRRMLRLTFRNYKVWRKLTLPSISMNVLEPLVFLFGFGLGVGALIGDIEGTDYLQYIAAGMVGYGAMQSASFEALYSAFTRMHVQRTWQGILNTPMTLDDVLLGEWVWAGMKGAMAGVAMLLVVVVLGLAESWLALPFIMLVIILTALAFSAIGLAVNALANSYDFFSYYFTLFITPMMMLSGAFFPIAVLPAPLQIVSAFLPLTHSVELVRPLMTGGDIALSQMALSVVVLLIYTTVGLYLSTILTRRRLLK